MKKIRCLILVIMLLVMLCSFDCMALKHTTIDLEMEIPDSFEKVEDVSDYSTVAYVNAEQGQIRVMSKFNMNDISYSNLTDAEIWEIERNADSMFIEEGSGDYFISEPEATRVYTSTFDGGKIDGVRVKASFFNMLSNMEVFSTVYLFSFGNYYHGISFVSYDDGQYWYKSCLDSLMIGEKYAEYTTTTTTQAEAFTSSYTKENKTKSSSDFSLADFFEYIGRIGAIVVIMYLGRSVIRKKK